MKEALTHKPPPMWHNRADRRESVAISRNGNRAITPICRDRSIRTIHSCAQTTTYGVPAGAPVPDVAETAPQSSRALAMGNIAQGSHVIAGHDTLKTVVYEHSTTTLPAPSLAAGFSRYPKERIMSYEVGKDFLTISGAAAVLGVSRGTAANWSRAGILPVAFKTPGGARRYSKRQLEEWRENQGQR